jgi:hypothetical protein
MEEGRGGGDGPGAGLRLMVLSCLLCVASFVFRDNNPSSKSSPPYSINQRSAMAFFLFHCLSYIHSRPPAVCAASLAFFPSSVSLLFLSKLCPTFFKKNQLPMK